jgi:hypothetical protein
MAVPKASAELSRTVGSVKLGGKNQVVFSNSKPRLCDLKMFQL